MNVYKESNFKIIETTEINVELIDSGTIQVRTRDVEKNLEDLAQSIKNTIMINPITVYIKDDGRYELVTGQRRLLATKEILKHKTIRATVIEKPKYELTAKMLSFIENEERKRMPAKDTANFCNVMYAEEKSTKRVSEILHLPYDTVKHAVDLPRIPEQVRKSVIDGNISVTSAVMATDAYIWEPASSDANDDERKKNAENAKKVFKLASIMQTDAKTREMQKAIVETGQEDITAVPEEIAEKGKTHTREEIRIKLYNKDKKRLQSYADAHSDGNTNDAASQLLLDGLDDAGV